jgi:hypothetical protein
MKTPAMPLSIRAAIVAFFFLFFFFVYVLMVFFWSLPLKPTGWVAIIASLIANPLALVYAMKRRKWAFDLLKWIAAFSIVWTVSGGPYLSVLGVWSIALIALCVWLRVLAFIMLRRESAREWIDSAMAARHL